MSKFKFRSFYDRELKEGFLEKVSGIDQCDPSGYIPIEQQVANFMRGEMPKASKRFMVDDDENLSDDERFRRSDEDDEANEHFAITGEEALASELVITKKRLSQRKSKKDTAHSPTDGDTSPSGGKPPAQPEAPASPKAT